VKAVSQRYFVRHIKELTEPVEVTLSVKGQVKTLGIWTPDGYQPKPNKGGVAQP